MIFTSSFIVKSSCCFDDDTKIVRQYPCFQRKKMQIVRKHTAILARFFAFSH